MSCRSQSQFTHMKYAAEPSVRSAISSKAYRTGRSRHALTNFDRSVATALFCHHWFLPENLPPGPNPTRPRMSCRRLRIVAGSMLLHQLHARRPKSLNPSEANLSSQNDSSPPPKKRRNDSIGRVTPFPPFPKNKCTNNIVSHSISIQLDFIFGCIGPNLSLSK